MEQHNILNDTYRFINRFTSFPNEHSKVVIPLWILYHYLTEEFYTSPRLYITSATKRCGKSTLLSMIKLLGNKTQAIINPSPASLYTLIELEHPTLLIDEVDRLFSKRDTYDITAIINSGFTKGETVPRVIMEPARKVEHFNVFGPMVLAGIDRANMPDTILDRCIQVRLKRMYAGEDIIPYRPTKHDAEGSVLKEQLKEVAQQMRDKVRGIDPIFPKGIDGRNADKWEPLFIVADVADNLYGSEWGIKIRDAALFFLDNDIEKPDQGELLLKDIESTFEDWSEEYILTDSLLDRLYSVEESDWMYHEHGKHLSRRQLASMLSPFGIKPDKIRTENNKRGYYKSDFADALMRHIHTKYAATSALSATSAPIEDAGVNVAVPTSASF